MKTEHPITPPPELVQQWYDNMGPDPGPFESFAIAAARWGADQELEACCAWVDANFGQEFSQNLRLLHRPKPPSLKEQSLEALKHAEEGWRPVPADCDIIRRALESLPD